MIKRLNRKGFTLIELLVVIAILGILVLLGFPKYRNYMDDAKLAQIKNDTKVAGDIVTSYLSEHKEFPDYVKEMEVDTLNERIIDKRVYDTKGLVKEEVDELTPLSEDQLIPEGGKYYIIDKLAREQMKSRLTGEFITDANGKGYYIDKVSSREDGEDNGQPEEPEGPTKPEDEPQGPEDGETIVTMRLGEVPLGSIVYDADWEWEYSGAGINKSKNVEWLVTGHNISGYPANSTTLITNEVIGVGVYDHQGSTRSDIAWASYGYLNRFKDSMGREFKSRMMSTSFANTDGNGTDYYVSSDIFLPAQRDLGGGDVGSYRMGTNWNFFSNNKERESSLHGQNGGHLYWTRSPSSGVNGQPLPGAMKVVGHGGDFYSRAGGLVSGIRPATNLRSSTLVQKQDNGKYKIIWTPPLSGDYIKLPQFEAEEVQALIDENYIPIATAEDLEAIKTSKPHTYAKGTRWEKEYEGGLNKKYIQIANISLAHIANFEPIGTFRGVYNGGNSRIFDLKINVPQQDFVGLFEYTNGATITNVGLVNGRIKGKQNVGSLVGASSNTVINNSFSNISVEGYDRTGGLIGQTSAQTKISESYSSGDVIGSKNTGGVIGISFDTTVDRVYTTGNVTGQGMSTGGLIGQAQTSKMSKSYTTGTTFGGNRGGGLIGSMLNTIIENTYTTGLTQGRDNIGGLVGMVLNQDKTSKISNSYATGRNSGPSSSSGGLVAYVVSRVEVVNSYYDKNSTGKSDTSKGIGLTTAQMKQQSSYNGWDFNAIWEMEPGKYPTLR